MTGQARKINTQGSAVRGNRARPALDEATLERANAAARRVQHRETTVRNGFIRLARDLEPTEDQRPPLATLLRSSRGAMRLKLYLALLWLAGGGETKKGHAVNFPARAYAELLGLHDPGGNGQRRVREALTSFAEAGLVILVDRPGYPKTVALLREDASGEAYDRPGIHFKETTDAEQPDEKKASVHQFVRLGPEFWTQGWAQVLSAPAVAVLLAMLVVTRNGQDANQWLSLSQRRFYGLSGDTWTRGTAELMDYGILVVRRAPVSSDPFTWKRMRNTYSLILERLSHRPDEEGHEFSRPAADADMDMDMDMDRAASPPTGTNRHAKRAAATRSPGETDPSTSPRS